MEEHSFDAAVGILQEGFTQLAFLPGSSASNGSGELIYQWPGPEDEAILVCVHKCNGEQEPFHRHAFFYFNYTYKGQYDSLSYKYDHRITIRENELYAGQPYAGHALCPHDNHETIIIGVLIRQDVFFRAFLPMLSADTRLFRFLIDPVTDHFSQEFLHFRVEEYDAVRKLLEMMVVEYAFKRHDTQAVLKSLALAFLMHIFRRHSDIHPEPAAEKLSGKIVQYLSAHCDTATLKSVAEHFSYHPNYISTLMHRELGMTFSEALLEQRMNRAAILLKGTTLSIEEIAIILGYAGSSNFYKAFKAFFHCSPREYAVRISCPLYRITPEGHK